MAEVIRIEMRGGAVLNRRGEFNRCSLTRLGLDDKWEKEKWDKAWEGSEDETNIPEGRDIVETKKKKNIFGWEDKLNSKRRKLDNTDGEVWGEAVGPEVVAINKFLTSTLPSITSSGQQKQVRLRVITGLEWMALEIVRSLVHEAVRTSENVKEICNWPEWEKEMPIHNQPEESPPSPPQENKESAQKVIKTTVSTTASRKRGTKKPLPGVTATQRGVESFFRKLEKSPVKPPARRTVKRGDLCHMTDYDEVTSVHTNPELQKFRFSSPVSNKENFKRSRPFNNVFNVFKLEERGSPSTMGQSKRKVNLLPENDRCLLKSAENPIFETGCSAEESPCKRARK